MKRQKNPRYSLGELIAALFDETNKLSNRPLERTILAYVALKHLLERRLRSKHPIAFLD